MCSSDLQMAAFGAFYEQVFPCVMLHTRFIWGSYQNVDHAPPVCGIPNLGPDSASYYMTTRCGMMGSAAARTRWGARVGDGFECVSCLYGRHPRSCLAPGCRCPRESVLQPPMRACYIKAMDHKWRHLERFMNKSSHALCSIQGL